jgi:SAM-dependent methyltransferase
MTKKEELIQLYALNSKHSNYQILSRRLSSLISQGEIRVKTRFEAERLVYILDHVNVNNKSIVDIGGNSGFFTFELIENGAQSVHYFEGNPVHYEFVKLAAEVLDVTDKIEVTNRYLSFREELKDKKYDVILLLNVLHHLGDDFGDAGISMNKAREEIIFNMKNIARNTSVMVFQLGFNWKGNRNTCLFETGTKKEMIDYLKDGLKDDWDFTKIGIAQKKEGRVVYEDLNEDNIRRDDSLGEFLNRPIFILTSKRTIVHS